MFDNKDLNNPNEAEVTFEENTERNNNEILNEADSKMISDIIKRSNKMSSVMTNSIDISDVDNEEEESDDDFENRLKSKINSMPKNIPSNNQFEVKPLSERTDVVMPKPVAISDKEIYESSISIEVNKTDVDNVMAEEVVTESKSNGFINEVDENMSFDFDDSEENVVKEYKAENSSEKRETYYKSYADVNKESSNDSSNNQKIANKNFLNKITVDLNNINIVDKNALKQVEDLSFVFEKSIPTFKVTCCQSGYNAALSGLTLSEKNAITNSNLNLFESKQRLYKTIYNKIQALSFSPKPTFDEWLTLTSFGDISTLLFGIYCQTFIDNNEFDITCGNCKKVTGVTIDNQSLIEVRDKEVFGRIEDQVINATTREELQKISILGKYERILLNDSKIVVDVGSPSLWDQLSLIKRANPKLLEDYTDIFAAMLYIKNIFMLDSRTTYDTGVPHYYKITHDDRKLDILLKLSNNDGEQLETAINKALNKYRIDYEIHNVKCSNCGEKLPNIPVDIETILFTRMNRTTTA